MFDKILILCTANICRSPMAEAAMQRAVGQKATIRSAGIDALVGHQADPDAQQVALQRGMDLSEHRAVQVNRDLLHWADLVLVMEEAHRAELRARQPGSSGKVLLLGQWNHLEIPDPYRKGVGMFEQTMDLIEGSIAAWMQRL